MTRSERLGAAAWILSLQFFVVQAIVQSAWDVPFSLAHNMISDLGRATCGPLYRAPGIEVACSPWHGLMNASILLNGLLIPAGALLTRRRWPAGRAMAVALSMIALTAPGHVLVALFPSDTGPALHVAGAGSILALGNPGMLVAGYAARAHHRSRAAVSMSLGAAGITGTVLFLWSLDPGIGLGGLERMAFYPLTIWCGVQGAALRLGDGRRRRED
ncbi:MAG: DUF998 domain-containing protein [Gemmatimonadaceae bacterium]|nr:DUF998 domain-containing protein [Gemmatimonadaceae bacterium]